MSHQVCGIDTPCGAVLPFGDNIAVGVSGVVRRRLGDRAKCLIFETG